MGSGALAAFHPPVQEWFRTSFPEPTPAQEKAWPAIRGGESTLLMAPTGSGKTLAAFLSAIDDLIQTPSQGCRVVYVSPMKALAVDVERNLRAPIAGIGHAAERLGVAVREPTVAIRTGDTPAKDRVRFAKTPVRSPRWRSAPSMSSSRRSFSRTREGRTKASSSPRTSMCQAICRGVR